MRILLADDQSNIRSALRLLLEQEDNLTVADEVSNSKELIATVARRCPDLILLDWELPGSKSEELVPALREKCPELVIVALVVDRRPGVKPLIQALMGLSARGARRNR